MKTLHTVYSYDLNEKIKFMKKMVKTLLTPEHAYKYEYFFHNMWYLIEVYQSQNTVTFFQAWRQYCADLTHFQPMFQSWINQVVGFYYRNV